MAKAIDCDSVDTGSTPVYHPDCGYEGTGSDSGLKTSQDTEIGSTHVTGTNSPLG